MMFMDVYFVFIIKTKAVTFEGKGESMIGLGQVKLARQLSLG